MNSRPWAKDMKREAKSMSKSSLVTYTSITSHKSSGRGSKKVDKIFLHHMAGNLTVQQCGNVFKSAQASAHYGVNGKNIGCYVDEKDTAWHCGNFSYNQRSIGIELANDRGASGDWHVSDKTIDTAIELIADICKRNGIKKLKYTGDLKGNLCMHCWICSTACPGPYLKTKFKYIAEQVNKILDGTSVPFLVRVSISDLYIRKGAGTSYKTNGFIKPGVYTITKTKGSWGKLKSGKGWICLKYATIL